MKTILPKRLFFLFFIFALSSVYSQNTLKGVVVDSLTNEALVGATVALDGTSFGAPCDLEGDYRINNIPDGKYKIHVSYIGYKFKVVEVNLANKKVLEINFQLNAEAIEGKTIEVSAQAAGQAAAINQQLSSNKIVNIVSEQKIKELPDANAAEALGRLPGISIVRSGGEANQIILRGLSESYASITLNGTKLSSTDKDSRGVDLSTIAQGSLSGIAVTKAVTSDMDGAAIAGSVDFVTKSAPEVRTIEINAQGSYEALDKTTNQYNFFGSYGERFFDNLLGVQVFGNIEQRIRTNENYGVDYTQTLNNNGNWDWNIRNFTVRYVPETRKRRGARVLLDFKTPDEGVIKFDASYDRTDRDFSEITREYPVEWSDPTYSFIGHEINTNIITLALHGENNFEGWQVNWNASFTQSESDEPYNFQLNFTEPSTLDASGNIISGMYAIPDDLRRGPYEALIPYAVNNFDYAYLNYGYIRRNNNLDMQKTISFDIKKDYTLFNFGGTVKFGGKYNEQYHRRSGSYDFSPYYNAAQVGDCVVSSDGSIVPKDWGAYGFGNLKTSNGLILMSNFIGRSTRNIYDSYLLNPILDANVVRNWYDISKNGISSSSKVREYSDGTSEDGTDYAATEGIAAAYLMNTFNFGNFATLITGVRFEADNNEYSAYYTPDPVTIYSVFSDTTSNHKETAVLPNFQLILKPTDFMNIRLAAYKGITRPGFNNRLPTYVLVGTAAYVGTPMVRLGNTDLKNGSAWNYEINFQFYGNDIGLLSLSSYYKEIDNQIEALDGFPVGSSSTVPSDLGIHFINNKRPFTTSYNLYYPYNSTHQTKVWGFEIEQQTNFLFLPGYLSGLTLSYNFSLVKCETYTPFTKIVYDTTFVAGFPVAKPRATMAEVKTRIINSPEFFCNVVLGYDIFGFSARLSYFYQGNFYNGYTSDLRSNNQQNSFKRIDISLKQKINANVDIGLNINNINDYKESSSLKNQFAGWTLQTSSVRFGTTADLWLRYRI
jgi:TonB-dependent receptor